jgi:hypothetical protein
MKLICSIYCYIFVVVVVVEKKSKNKNWSNKYFCIVILLTKKTNKN